MNIRYFAIVKVREPVCYINYSSTKNVIGQEYVRMKLPPNTKPIYPSALSSVKWLFHQIL